MHSIIACLSARLVLSFVFIGSAVCADAAQTFWLDTIAQQETGCVKGTGKLEGVDFGQLLRDNAKAAGATEVGYAFLTKANPDGTDWEACAVYKGAAQQTGGLHKQVVPASPGAFTLCEGTDAKQCSDALVAWIKAKSPDFNTLPRIIPLFGYSADKLDTTKQSVNTLILQTFPISADETASKVPEPATELDRQLYGTVAQLRQPRPLLTSPVPSLPNVARKGGEQRYNAILVFVPISEAQKAALGAL
jgi:hypothetical protein